MTADSAQDGSSPVLRIATRQSKLALWQAHHVQAELRRAHPGLNVELLGITTEGDRRTDVALGKIGGKGVFVKELESALLDGRADFAVHSAKDVPAELPPGLELSVFLPRAEPIDALVLPIATDAAGSAEQVPGADVQAILAALPSGAIVGTSSLRRQLQLQALRPDLRFEPIRGNVDTRLAKLDAGAAAALVLAASGLERLDPGHRISARFAPEEMLPAGGQGALGIELRAGDTTTSSYLQPLHDATVGLCVAAERRVSQQLGGSCTMPLAAFAEYRNSVLTLRASLGDPNTGAILTAAAELSGEIGALRPAELGDIVAEQLTAAGAGPIIESLR